MRSKRSNGRLRLVEIIMIIIIIIITGAGKTKERQNGNRIIVGLSLLGRAADCCRWRLKKKRWDWTLAPECQDMEAVQPTPKTTPPPL